VAGTRADASRDVASIGAGARRYASDNTLHGRVVLEDGRNARWATPSANVQLQERGRNTRWFNPSGNAELSSMTTQRGQDITAGTARRGQDFKFSLGTERNRIARDRDATLKKLAGAPDGTNDQGSGQSPAAVTPQPSAAPTQPPPRVGGGGQDSPQALEPVSPSALVTPRVSISDLRSRSAKPPESNRVASRPGDRASDDTYVQALMQEGSGLLQRYKAEADPIMRAQIGADLRRVRAELMKYQKPKKASATPSSAGPEKR